MATFVIRKGRAKPLWFGHPWVYSEAVERVDGGVLPGDAVRVVDHDGRFIGMGFANPRSQIRVRIVSRRDEPLDETWLRRQLTEARDLRARLGLPSRENTAYRLANSEGDSLPGLIVDVYGDAACIQFSTFAMKQRETSIFDALEELLHPKTIYEVAAGGFAQVEGFASSARVVRGDPRPRIACKENGFDLVIEPLAGQKTGYFLDQRENRVLVEKLAHGCRVLDLYCYAGGFSMAAQRGGAKSVVAVDVSARALERAREHFGQNGLGELETVESDVFRYLEQAPAGAFDLVICDPPKFARARKDLPSALKGYRRLNALAMQACAPSAIMCTASCSQLVSADELERVLSGAAQDAHRRVQLVSLSYQASDHVLPLAFPEGRYLKFVVLRVL
ncbi:MAG: class I SAM-dependent rRNA methyltransferase [Deltaproteobacteria bacterium]|nr:class I SAM-dependent rRNA methyltransferase [Deltaproteobacteria bacterium]